MMKDCMALDVHHIQTMPRACWGACCAWVEGWGGMGWVGCWPCSSSVSHIFKCDVNKNLYIYVDKCVSMCTKDIIINMCNTIYSSMMYMICLHV